MKRIVALLLSCALLLSGCTTQEKYEDVSTAIEDLGIDTKIELKRICDEIFADG